jgi:hypothetical protein
LGIDRIGGGGGIPPEGLAPKAGASRPDQPRTESTPFEVHRTSTGAADATGAVHGVTSPALEAVKNGTLDVKGYVDAKVTEATAHLTHLAPAQLHAVQEVVRSQLMNDPHLRELVERATGSALPSDDS